MARYWVLLSFVVAVFMQSSQALGGIEERLGRMQEIQDNEKNEVCNIVESTGFLPQGIFAIPAHSATRNFRKTSNCAEGFRGLNLEIRLV